MYIINGKVRPEKIESAQARINQLLDQSVIATDDARKYIINEEGKELDLSIIDIDELKAEFRQVLDFLLKWLRELDLNQRPSGYEPDELPDCSIPRYSICT